MPDQTIKCPKCNSEIKLSVLSTDKAQYSDTVITQKLENYRYFHQFLMSLSTKCLAISGVLFGGFAWCYKNIQEKHWASWYSGFAIFVTISFFFMVIRGNTLVRNSAEDVKTINDFAGVMEKNLIKHGWNSKTMVLLLIVPWIVILIIALRGDPFYQEKPSILEFIGNLFMNTQY